jgi:SAM-dependent methyltransferase
MTRADRSTTERVARFYRDLSSLEMVLGALALEGVNVQELRASDLYSRGLDCQNLGALAMLEVLAGVVAEYSAPNPDAEILDIGCGLGGPGRFLVDRFGCSILGTDLVAKRIEIAQALTQKTGLQGRIAYRRADATHLPFPAGAFAQVWMLDVSIHVRDKRGLFGEIARVLRPGGLLVMHDQLGPLPETMRPVTRQAPYIAPSLPQLIRFVDESRLRVLTWRDTTPIVLAYFQAIRAKLLTALAGAATDDAGPWREQGQAILNGYIETLSNPGGRTGILVAQRRISAQRRTRSRAHGRPAGTARSGRV